MFSWHGISFSYPSSWEAEVWQYGSAAMSAEGQFDEVGFLLWKRGSRSQPDSPGVDFNFDYYIEAGGPQSFGDTCANMNSGGNGIRRPYVRCADLAVRHRGNEPPTIAVITRSSNPETLTVFEEITAKSQSR
jgi:hypothetical protein